MVHHTIDQRVCALIAYAKADGVIKSAVPAFIGMLTEKEVQTFPRPDQFIRDTQEKWDADRTVEDEYQRRNPSHPKLVTDAVAQQCAAALKGGYFKRVCVDQPDGTCQVVKVHRYYTSINQAIAHNQLLGSVIEQYAVTPEYLLERMHQVDPSLCKRVVEFKWRLTEAQKAERRFIADWLYKKWENHKKLLLSVWWMDETAIWIVTSHTTKLRVWADAHDQGVRAVLSSPHVQPHDDNKVHVMGAVNALLGTCFLEFTTGTTGDFRFYPRAEGAYMVGCAYLTAACIHLQADCTPAAVSVGMQAHCGVVCNSRAVSTHWAVTPAGGVRLVTMTVQCTCCPGSCFPSHLLVIARHAPSSCCRQARQLHLSMGVSFGNIAAVHHAELLTLCWPCCCCRPRSQATRRRPRAQRLRSLSTSCRYWSLRHAGGWQQWAFLPSSAMTTIRFRPAPTWRRWASCPVRCCPLPSTAQTCTSPLSMHGGSSSQMCRRSCWSLGSSRSRRWLRRSWFTTAGGLLTRRGSSGMCAACPRLGLSFQARRERPRKTLRGSSTPAVEGTGPRASTADVQ